MAALNAIQNNFGMPSVYPDYEAERLKNEQAAREGIWTDQDDLVAFKQSRKVQAVSEVQRIDRALRQMGVLSPGQRSLLEDRDFALECVHFTESLPTSIGGVAFEAGNLVMTALPVVGAVGRATLQTARLASHMAGSAVRATLPGLRGSAVSLLTTGQEVAQSLRLPSLRFANATAGEARLSSNEVVAFRSLPAARPSAASGELQPVHLWSARESAALHDEAPSYTLTLTYKDGMNQRDFSRKVRALQDLAERGKLVKTEVVRDRVITREYRENLIAAAERKWGQTDPLRLRKFEDSLETMHADHLHELQLGGVDHPTSLWMLDRRVNSSIGAQIQQQTVHLPIGTRIGKIIIRGLPQ